MTRVDERRIGASFSVRACRQFGLDTTEVLTAALTDLGMRHYRLMSYWDEYEQQPGVYNFNGIIQQLDILASHNATATFCLGIRQPRWPECHMPGWAKSLQPDELQTAALAYIAATLDAVAPFIGSAITSVQLENEFYNRGIGTCTDYSRSRLKAEIALVRSRIPETPLVLTTSNSISLPLRAPRPDKVGFSIYRYQYQGDAKRVSPLPAQWYRVRAAAVKALGMDVFCHELQAEPWGAKSTEQLPWDEQLQLMDEQRIQQHVAFALKSGLQEIDLWGLEWWYWAKTHHNHPGIWEAVRSISRA